METEVRRNKHIKLFLYRRSPPNSSDTIRLEAILMLQRSWGLHPPCRSRILSDKASGTPDSANWSFRISEIRTHFHFLLSYFITEIKTCNFTFKEKIKAKLDTGWMSRYTSHNNKQVQPGEPVHRELWIPDWFEWRLFKENITLIIALKMWYVWYVS